MYEVSWGAWPGFPRNGRNPLHSPSVSGLGFYAPDIKGLGLRHVEGLVFGF